MLEGYLEQLLVLRLCQQLIGSAAWRISVSVLLFVVKGLLACCFKASWCCSIRGFIQELLRVMLLRLHLPVLRMHEHS